MKPLKSVLLAPFLLSSLSFISLPTEHPTASLFPSLLEASYPAFFFLLLLHLFLCRLLHYHFIYLPELFCCIKDQHVKNQKLAFHMNSMQVTVQLYTARSPAAFPMGPCLAPLLRMQPFQQLYLTAKIRSSSSCPSALNILLLVAPY